LRIAAMAADGLGNNELTPALQLRLKVCKTGENGQLFRRESYTQNGRRRTPKTVENVQRFRLTAYTHFG
jgi:hypothetical protein